MMSETKIPPLNPTSQTQNPPDGSWLFDSRSHRAAYTHHELPLRRCKTDSTCA